MATALSWIFLPVIFALVSSILRWGLTAYTTVDRYDHLSWPGARRPSWWAMIRLRLMNTLRFQQRHINLAQEYWAHGKACFVPSLLEDDILLPPEDLIWLAEQGDDIVDNMTPLKERLQTKYTIASPQVLHDLVHGQVISRDLTRRTVALIPSIYDELSATIEEEWGMDTARWRQVNLWDTFVKVLTRTSNRVLLGTPLCRNRSLNHHTIALATTVIPSAFLIRAVPEALRYWIAPLITLKNKYHQRNLAKLIGPEILKRISTVKAHNKEDESSSLMPEQKSFLQWNIETASGEGTMSKLFPALLIERVRFLNFAAIHTTTVSATNTLHDLLSHPDANYVIRTLRKEIAASFTANNDTWTKAALSQLPKLDSALKESMRLSPLSSILIARKVTAKDGITTPTSQTYLPYGSIAAIPTMAIHLNPEIYADPEVYKPFRFSQVRAPCPLDIANGSTKSDVKFDRFSTFVLPPGFKPLQSSCVSPHDGGNDNPQSSRPTLRRAKTSVSLDTSVENSKPIRPALRRATTSVPHPDLTSASSSFLSFGAGRHPCPGRFLAAAELKLLFAYVLMHYDFDFNDIGPRKERTWAGPVIMPERTMTIRVRRRKKEG